MLSHIHVWRMGGVSQVLNVLADCIEKEGYGYVVEDDLQGGRGTDHTHSSPRQR